MASPLPQPAWPSYVRPPLTSVSPTNQSGIIAIVTGFSLGLVLLSTGVRFYAKQSAGVLRYDDFAFYAAAVLALGQTGVVCFLVSRGSGRVTDLLHADELVSIRRGELASNLLYIFVVAFSKISCATMFLVITPYQRQRLVAWILVGASLTWLMTSLFLEGLQCHSFPIRCPGFYPRWLYIGLMDMLTEAALVSYSIYIVSPRQMTLGAKLTVIFVFACRTPNIACTIIRLIFLHAPLTPTSSPFYTARLHAVTQLAIAYTVTSCVIPYLRPLLQAHENSDGSLRRSSAHPSFKLSQSSKWSGTQTGKKYFKLSRGMSVLDARPGVKANAMAVAATYEDVGRLLGPPKAVLVRSRSVELPVAAGVAAMDWDLGACDSTCCSDVVGAQGRS